MQNFITKYWKHIQKIGVGLFLYESFNFLYDWIFYPFSLAYWGLALGGAIVVIGSVCVNAFVFWLYDYMRVDWLGAHALRELEEKENKNSLEKLGTWIGKKKTTLRDKILSPFVFITLTLPIDPLIVAVHYREKHFEGVNRRDWTLLILATLSANMWWLVKIGFVVEVIRYLWHLIAAAL